MLNLSSEALQALRGRDIICVSSMAYANMWTRKQRLMTIFAEMGNRVLYVEPSWPILATKGDKGHFKSKVTEVRPNLWVASPRGRLPLGRIERLKTLDFRHLRNLILSTCKDLNFSNPILFTYTPAVSGVEFSLLSNDLPHRLLVYDCVDEHSESIGLLPGMRHLIKKWDASLTQSADLVFVTALGLYENRKHLNPNLYLSPNGADLDHFSKAKLPDTKIPEDVWSIPEPRIGFVGALSEWIDYTLIEKIARTFPKFQIVLVGPLKRGLEPSNLKSLSNVHFLGRKSLAELPGYLKSFACGINPFCKIPLAEKVNPLKVYEYLAAGVPVVSVDMPEVMSLEGVVRIARDHADFLAGVDEAVKREFRPDLERLNETVQRHNWDTIFCELLEKVARMLL